MFYSIYLLLLPKIVKIIITRQVTNNRETKINLGPSLYHNLTNNNLTNNNLTNNNLTNNNLTNNNLTNNNLTNNNLTKNSNFKYGFVYTPKRKKIWWSIRSDSSNIHYTDLIYICTYIYLCFLLY